MVYLCLKPEPPRPKKKPAPVYDTNGALLVTATTITIRMPVCYYSDDHGPIKKIQVLVVEAETLFFNVIHTLHELLISLQF